MAMGHNIESQIHRGLVPASWGSSFAFVPFRSRAFFHRTLSLLYSNFFTPDLCRIDMGGFPGPWDENRSSIYQASLRHVCGEHSGYIGLFRLAIPSDRRSTRDIVQLQCLLNWEQQGEY